VHDHHRRRRLDGSGVGGHGAILTTPVAGSPDARASIGR
jgi:hypothetical protein